MISSERLLHFIPGRNWDRVALHLTIHHFSLDIPTTKCYNIAVLSDTSYW